MAWEQQLEMNNFEIAKKRRNNRRQRHALQTNHTQLKCAVRVRESGFIKNVWVKITLQIQEVTLNLNYKLNILKQK